MSHTATRASRPPTLRHLRDELHAPREFWDDPDLAPRRRRETPLSAWG